MAPNTEPATAVTPRIPALEAVLALMATKATTANTTAGLALPMVRLMNAPKKPVVSHRPMDSISRPIIIMGEKL